MKFAHFADTHLGFQNDIALQNIEADTFQDAISRCISGVDFVLMCGDIFHTNIPEMRVQKHAMKQFRRLYEANIPVYAVYGSHDYSPVNNSFIDLLVSAGYIKKIEYQVDDGGMVRPLFAVDKKTGVKITGLSGQKAGRDSQYYEMLDRDHLESEPGFKIFMFHGPISEMINAQEGETSMPVSMLPRGFQYYAGGHIHRFMDRSFNEYNHVVYPGPILAGYHSDMEETARGQQRGYVVVDFDNQINNIEIAGMDSCQYALLAVDAEGRSADNVNLEIQVKISTTDVQERVAILRIGGELSAGRVTDIDMGQIRNTLFQNGAIAVKIQRQSLTSKEYKIRGTPGSTSEQIESDTFQNNIGQVRTTQDILRGERGVGLAQSLLASLRNPRPINETKKDYELRMRTDAIANMELDT